MPYYRLVEAVSALARFDGGGDGDDAMVSEQALTALNKGRGAFQEDDVALICSAMSSRIHNPLIAAAACRAFSSLALDQQMEARPWAQSCIVQEGGLTKILEAMVVNAGDIPVQEHGCWALGALARKHNTNAKLLVQGLDRAVPQAIKYAMDGNQSSISLQEKGCSALRSLCDDDDDNARVLLEEGLLATLGTVMESHPDSAAVQRQACTAISAMAQLPAMRQAAGEQGYVTLILTALRRHMDSTGVVEQVLGALSNLGLEGSLRLQMAEEGCTDQIREVMFKHKYHPGLQQACCNLVANLAVSPDNQTVLVADGCMELSLEAMRNFSSAPEVQQHGALALAAMVNNHAENKMHANQLGVFASLRMARANHGLDVGVNEAVCRFVLYFMADKMLVRGTTFKALVVSEGFVEQLCECLKANPQSKPVTVWACRAIHHLANRSSEHKTTLVKAGVISLACNAMAHHPQDDTVLPYAVAVLLSLSAEKALHPVLVRHGCIEQLREAMRVHSGHVKLQEDCIWALLNIAWVDEGCQHAVREAGVAPYVIEARIRHKGSGSQILDGKARDLLDKLDPHGMMVTQGMPGGARAASASGISVGGL